MKTGTPGTQASAARMIALALALIGTLVAVQLCWPPPVGLANSGDFERMMKWGGLGYVTAEPSEKYFAWINTEFRFVESPWRPWHGFGSSEAVFVKLAAVIGWLLPGEQFDLRWLGAVHLICFLVAVGLLLVGWARLNGRSPWWLVPGVLLIFCDLGYTIYFHSFYSESATLIFLLALVGSGFLLIRVVAQRELARGWAWPAVLLLFCFCAGLLLTAKPQNLALLPLVLLFCARLFFQPMAAMWRGRVILIAFAAAMFAVAMLLSLLMPVRMRQANLYNATFNGLLKRSGAPERDLRALGLPESYAALAGTNYFSPPHPQFDLQSAEFQTQFFARHSTLRLARFYLLHPARLWRELAATAEQSHRLRLEQLGNFPQASGRPVLAQAHRWDGWSRFKQRSWPKSPALLAAYCLVWAALLARGYWHAQRTEKLMREFCLMLLLMLPVAFITPVLGDGENDLVKHLFLFNALFDLSLLLGGTHLAIKGLRVLNERLDLTR